VTVVALVPDLMDRSRLGAVVDTFVRNATELAVVDADVAVIDLSREGAIEAAGALVARGVRVVAFGSHVDKDTLDQARATGADVMPRSKLFADPDAAVKG
jgi:hypothetical protein